MSTTFSSAVKRYCKEKRHSKGTSDEYNATVNKWISWGQDVPLEQFSRSVIRDFLDWVYDQAVARGGQNPERTSNKARDHIRAVAAWAWENDIIESLPRFPKPRSQRDVAGRQYLSKAELNALYVATYTMRRCRAWKRPHSIGHYWRSAIVLFFNYGLDTGTVWKTKTTHEPLLFGWSQKKLIRYLMTSRVYQLSSSEKLATEKHRDTDPAAALYWRMSPRRLEAEAIRDSMLAVGGKLNLERPVGSPVVDFEYYADIRNEDRIKAIELLSGDHRTIYVPTLRGHRNKLYELFNYPDDEAVNSARTSGSVPTQALYLMNNPMIMDYADALVGRLDSEKQTTPVERINRLYQLCYGRLPSKAEQTEDIAFLKSQAALSDERRAWSRLAHSFLVSGEFLYRF